MPKLKLTIGLIALPGFMAAFDRLGAENLSGKDKFALARTRSNIISNFETFDSERVKLVKVHGKPREELFAAQIARLKALNDPSVADQITKLETQLDAMAKTPGKNGWAIDETDTEAMDKFNDVIKQMKTVEFEVFLDHQVALPDKVNLSAKEIEILLPLIAEPV